MAKWPTIEKETCDDNRRGDPSERQSARRVLSESISTCRGESQGDNLSAAHRQLDHERFKAADSRRVSRYDARPFERG
eukprot:2981115-Pleurochrysis_carterae.AAC.1